MGNTKSTGMSKDMEYLEKAFKKLSPHILSSPYIPTPSVLVKSPEIVEKPKINNSNSAKSPTTTPSNFQSSEKYEEILQCLHRGSLAYSVGDYGTAIYCFTRLLENEWLKHSTYFYLVKTLIRLDIEKELLSIRAKVNPNNIKITKK